MKIKTGSAINAVAQPPKPRESEEEGLSLLDAVDRMEDGKRLFRHSSGRDDERWGYWESIKAYLVVTQAGRMDMMNGITGQVALFDWRPDLESIKAKDWIVLKF